MATSHEVAIGAVDPVHQPGPPLPTRWQTPCRRSLNTTFVRGGVLRSARRLPGVYERQRDQRRQRAHTNRATYRLVSDDLYTWTSSGIHVTQSQLPTSPADRQLRAHTLLITLP